MAACVLCMCASARVSKYASSKMSIAERERERERENVCAHHVGWYSVLTYYDHVIRILA